MAPRDRGALEAAARARGWTLELREGAPGLVVLAGWFGAQDRHLAKYSEEVGSAGFSTLRVQLPGVGVFAPGSVYVQRRFAWELLLFLQRVGEPFVMMTFSNGGAMVHRGMTWWLHRSAKRELLQDLGERWRGVVHDSAPAYMHAQTGVRALSTGLGLSPALVPLVWVVFLCYALLDTVC